MTLHKAKLEGFNWLYLSLARSWAESWRLLHYQTNNIYVIKHNLKSVQKTKNETGQTEQRLLQSETINYTQFQYNFCIIFCNK